MSRKPKRRRPAKGWKPRVDADGVASQYHIAIDAQLNLQDVGNAFQFSAMIASIASPFNCSSNRPDGIIKPSKCPRLKALIRERHSCRDRIRRGELSKKLHREMRQAMRRWRTEWASFLLQRWRNRFPLSCINAMAKGSQACPKDPNDFC